MEKKSFAVLLAACLLLLAACAGMAMSDPLPPAETEILQEAVYEAPEYEIIPFVYGNQVQAEDGKVIALYNYQTVLLSLHNPDAVSPADAEKAERNIETFNSRMQAVGEELAAQGMAMADDAREVYAETSSFAEEYEDDATVEGVFCGDIISLWLTRWSYTGGAHPNRYAVSYLFDLAAGQYINPIQLAEDPEVFRTGAAAILLEKLENHEAREEFWEDYAGVIEHWNEGTVQFSDEGMRVTYSPYELGPYAIGEIELPVSWEELAPLLGESGMARLGRETAEAAAEE